MTSFFTPVDDIELVKENNGYSIKAKNIIGVKNATTKEKPPEDDSYRTVIQSIFVLKSQQLLP